MQLQRDKSIQICETTKSKITSCVYESLNVRLVDQ
jgi:hypothetical protein